jgi:hypothetical protein
MKFLIKTIKKTIFLSMSSFISTTEIIEIQPKTYEHEKRFRQQLQPSKKQSYTYEYNTMSHSDYNPPPIFPKRIPVNHFHENHYHEPQLAITYSVPVDKISSKVSNSNTSSTRKLQSDTISSSTESCKLIFFDFSI